MHASCTPMLSMLTEFTVCVCFPCYSASAWNHLVYVSAKHAYFTLIYTGEKSKNSNESEYSIILLLNIVILRVFATEKHKTSFIRVIEYTSSISVHSHSHTHTQQFTLAAALWHSQQKLLCSKRCAVSFLCEHTPLLLLLDCFYWYICIYSSREVVGMLELELLCVPMRAKREKSHAIFTPNRTIQKSTPNSHREREMSKFLSVFIVHWTKLWQRKSERGGRGVCVCVWSECYLRNARAKVILLFELHTFSCMCIWSTSSSSANIGKYDFHLLTAKRVEKSKSNFHCARHLEWNVWIYS